MLAENRGMIAYNSMSLVERMQVLAAAPELLSALCQLTLHDIFARHREGCDIPKEIEAAVEALHKAIPHKHRPVGLP